MRGKKNWRLSATLKRNVLVRPIEDADVGFAWAAYKKTGLPEIGFKEGLDAVEFKQAFEFFVLTTGLSAWTVSAFVKKKEKMLPVGIVLGQNCPRFTLIVAISWFPWASNRNVVEGTVGFFNSVRKEMRIMGFSTTEHLPLNDVCCAHGILRRVGTSYDVMGEKSAVFEGIT